MLLNGKNLTFSEADAKQKGTARTCIDGSVTGKNRCTGYCNYAGHRGFLTAALTAQHRCVEKNCVYRAAREACGVFVCPKPEPERELLRLARNLAADMEGLRLLSCAYTDGEYQITFAAVASYDLDALKARLEGEAGLKVAFRPLDCDFDTAARLVLEKEEEYEV